MDDASKAIGYVTSVGGAQVSVALTRFHAQYGGAGAADEPGRRALIESSIFSVT